MSRLLADDDDIEPLSLNNLWLLMVSHTGINLHNHIPISLISSHFMISTRDIKYKDTAYSKDITMKKHYGEVTLGKD